MTYGKPCVIRHAKANACVTHGKPCIHMHANGHAYKMGDQFVEERRSRKERRRKKKKERKRDRENEKKRERNREKRKSAIRRSELVGPRSKVRGLHSRGSDSSYFGLFSTIRVVGLCLCPKGLFGKI